MFVWAKPPRNGIDSLELARQALAQGIRLAPGQLFSPGMNPSLWLRFNVAYCDNDRLFRFMERGLRQH